VKVAPLAALIAAAALAAAASVQASGAHTVWLCKPGLKNDPCASSRAATALSAAGKLLPAPAAPARTPVDCFYVYPTVSREPTTNADLTIQPAEREAAVTQASRFSQVCRVYAPMYRQVTLPTLALHPKLDLPAAYGLTAYSSLLAGFDDYLAHDNDGRPIVFIGHSQGAAILIRLLEQRVDRDPALRRRLVLAIILGGDVEVPTGKLVGGSFAHIPLCSRAGEAGCVIAYSSFPSQPPAAALFGRPGQGVALQSNQAGTTGLQVACVNPAAPGGGSAALDTFFPSEGRLPTPWVEFLGLYTAGCRTGGGATWLQVTKAPRASAALPTVGEPDGPNWGYHVYDVNLALGNLVKDVAAASATWAKH
jgi:Protein of unknown function (DUF3089)